MKTVGIIGGIGPESTVEYYRLFIALFRQKVKDGSYPHILINSIDMKKMLDLVGKSDMKGLTSFLLAELQSLANAGARLGALASNTPHAVFDELREASPIPLVSIVETVCHRAKKLGLKRLGLLGTRFTMQGKFYQGVFSANGMDLVVPQPADLYYVHDKYMEELVAGVYLESTRERFFGIIEGMRKRDGIEGLILGGTELPPLFRDAQPGLPLLDTTRLHVERLVDMCLLEPRNLRMKRLVMTKTRK
jgi:aspartate racemase